MKFALILILSTLAWTSSDSLAVSRFRADSALAEDMFKQAAHSDSVAWSTRVSAETIFKIAIRNLHRDTAKVK